MTKPHVVSWRSRKLDCYTIFLSTFSQRWHKHTLLINKCRNKLPGFSAWHCRPVNDPGETFLSELKLFLVKQSWSNPNKDVSFNVRSFYCIKQTRGLFLILPSHETSLRSNLMHFSSESFSFSKHRKFLFSFLEP